MGIPAAPSFSIRCDTGSEVCFLTLLWSPRLQQCQQSNLIAFALAVPFSRTFPGLFLTLLPQQSCRGQPAALTLASLGLQDFPPLGSSLGNPEGQVISIVSSPSTADLESLPALWLPAPILWHFRPPRGLLLAPGGQAIQDRPTFPAGTLPRRNLPFFLLSQLGCESGKIPLTFFLSPSPQRTRACIDTALRGREQRWHKLEPMPNLPCLVRPSRSLQPGYSSLVSLRLQPYTGPRLRIWVLYLTSVWFLPHSGPSSDKRQSGA